MSAVQVADVEPKAHLLWRKLLPWLLALLFCVLSLTDRNLAEVHTADPPRHMLNGALLHDMIRSGSVLHPVEFARQFYTHYPAISLPYHPPLFPLFEAGLYSIFGVDTAVARMGVAIAVVVSVILLYAVVLELNGSATLAFLTTVTFFSLRICRDVASDVMLEFPVLALTLAALYVLRRFDRRFSMRTGILFALLGGAAVWTKQTSVFLGAVPWILTVLTRRWSYFRRAPIWLASAVFGLLVALLLAIPVVMLRWSGSNWKTHSNLGGLIRSRAFYYFAVVRETFLIGGLAVLVAGLLLAVVWIVRRKEGWYADSFYLAWIIPIFVAAALTPQFDERYILSAYPAMIALGYLALFRLAGRILPERWAWCPAFAAALFLCGFGFAFLPWQSLSGVRSAAQFLAGERPARILYCGPLDGSFIAALRVSNPQTQPILARSDQLPQEAQNPAGLDDFAHQFGIDHVVVWEGKSDELATGPASNMRLEKDFPIFDRSRPLGHIAVYRYTNPAPNAPSSLQIRSHLLGRNLDLEFEDK